MPMRVCIKCNKMFERKSTYDTHLNRKESCNPEYDRVMKIFYDKYVKEKEEKKLLEHK
jgi:hypothetical protein